MRAWANVKVKNPKLERDGQAGVTTEATPDTAKEVNVKFDTDGGVELVKVADLEVLSA